ncbi:MAG: sugar phosphate nucleotidyltransferase [Acidimicrobiia bacterium]|nr:sugar phosphate nucleotidyltransferase [Acidimicrobiia bacterium]
MNRPEVAVIPAAGRGTRMRPASRVVPKALITVVDRPCIQWAVEEAARSGATKVILVVNAEAGQSIHDHFHAEGPLPGLEDVRIRVAIQKEPHGLGHAVWTAQEEVGDRSFYCLLADTIAPPGVDFLTPLADAGGSNAVTLRELTDEYLERYGVIVPGAMRSDDVVEVKGAIEKPGKAKAPSNLGLVGRYVFSPEVFEVLATSEPGVGGEIQLTDAIDRLGRSGSCVGVIAPEDVLDVGNPLGLVEATTILGLAMPELRDDYRAFLARLGRQ